MPSLPVLPLHQQLYMSQGHAQAMHLRYSLLKQKQKRITPQCEVSGGHACITSSDLDLSLGCTGYATHTHFAMAKRREKKLQTYTQPPTGAVCTAQKNQIHFIPVTNFT